MTSFGKDSAPGLGCTRRQWLQAGALGASFSLANFLRLQAEAGESDRGRSAILVFLGGGPSHQDTLDMKPGAPAEYRGQFRPIRTDTAGVEICEHLPRLAKRSSRYAVVRGITHNLAAHSLGTRYLMTGNRPTPVLEYPMYGSVASREFPAAKDLPSFVSIDRPVEGPGYLGPEYGPLSTGEKPRYGQPFRVRGITLGDGLTIESYRDRRRLLQDIDNAFDGYERLDDAVRGLDRFSEQAFNIISSPRARNAFDLSLEPDREIERFGRHDFGQGMLLTSRLIEAGVRFVTVLLEGWDTHQDNFGTLGRELLPRLDQSLSGLLDRLGETGRLDSTTVLVTGEFGRTPKVNANAGRDHWARAMCAMMAGAGVATGQVIGETDAKAEGPVDKGFSPDDLAASFFQAMGIDPNKEYEANVGRPITLVRDGAPIAGLLK
ncbi:MAG: DUF1501 domain-containing protein [Planctomycetales bacterium]|nr:DUF1501 domain-containing protein [Planctomycetales bacterium]